MGSIVNELRGEKIDIIKYSEDPAEFIAAALAPADVVDVQLSDEGKMCRVVVPDDQLSLAIGKEGQNSSSNSRFTSPGWVREISTWGPRVLRRTSTTYTFTCWPSTSSSVRICSLEASMASVDSGPVPMRREGQVRPGGPGRRGEHPRGQRGVRAHRRRKRQTGHHATASSLLHTAILVRLPASRAMDFTSTMPSKISGTSSSNSRFTSPGWVREISTWVVPDDQLSLAIGKEGQNARLAARLTGYKIDIKPQSYREEE